MLKPINLDLFFIKTNALGRAKAKESSVALKARVKLNAVVERSSKKFDFAKPIKKI